MSIVPKSSVERAYTEKKARKYSRRRMSFSTRANALFSEEDRNSDLPSRAKSIMASSSYADKVRRLILASL